MAEINSITQAPVNNQTSETLQKALEGKKPEELNAALQRCAKDFNPETDARQAYDRMHHTHNRG